MSAIDEILEANKQYAESFEHSPMPGFPTRKLAVILCMDARIDPPRALGLNYGDAHIIRNAGGRVADALRSLVISQQLLGTEEVAIIHHTACGMMTFTDAELQQKLHDAQGIQADHIAFLSFRDLEQSIYDDIRAYEQSPLVRHDIPVRGLIYEVETGLLREVARNTIVERQERTPVLSANGVVSAS